MVPIPATMFQACVYTLMECGVPNNWLAEEKKNRVYLTNCSEYYTMKMRTAVENYIAPFWNNPEGLS